MQGGVDKSHLHLSYQILSQKNFTAMSADPNTPLFKISDGDDILYEDDPAMAQANLVAAERVQQERAKQRLEREEWKVQAEAVRLMREIEEAERK